MACAVIAETLVERALARPTERCVKLFVRNLEPTVRSPDSLIE